MTAALVETAIDKVARASPAGGSKRRQRDEVVASYWQRYCAKNDTIGFFGPLAWGRLVDDGPAIVARWPADREARQVHIEPWCLEALAESVGGHRRRPAQPPPGARRPPADRRPLAGTDTRPRPRRAPPDRATGWPASPPRRPTSWPARPPLVAARGQADLRRLREQRPHRHRRPDGRSGRAADEDVVVKFTEMLPTPEDCWLEDSTGNRYTELRMVAVELARRAGDGPP